MNAVYPDMSVIDYIQDTPPYIGVNIVGYTLLTTTRVSCNMEVTVTMDGWKDG